MGEAKKRGTYEERKAAAMKRDAEIFLKRKVAEIKRHQLMTPYEKEMATTQAELFATLLGIAGPAALGGRKVRT